MLWEIRREKELAILSFLDTGIFLINLKTDFTKLSWEGWDPSFWDTYHLKSGKLQCRSQKLVTFMDKSQVGS